MTYIEPRPYHLTDPAYNKIVRMAQRARYVIFGAERARGLSDYLNALSTIPLEDTRPPAIRQIHREEIASNRAPTWLRTKLRRARLLKLTDDAIERYILAALEAGIIQDKPYAVGGPSRQTPQPTISLVFEAIGLGWLTPVEEIRNPNASER